MYKRNDYKRIKMVFTLKYINITDITIQLFILDDSPVSVYKFEYQFLSVVQARPGQNWS